MVILSECVLASRVRSDGDDDLADNNLQLFILECKDRKAVGYADREFEIYNKRLQGLKIGVRLAGSPPAVSYLAILGALLLAEIVAVDKTVIVISLEFVGDGGRTSYLIYDAVDLSLRMIPPPRNPWIYTLSSNVSIARPCQAGGNAYALVLTGLMAGVHKGDSLYLWRPSSSSGPWLDRKDSSFPDPIDWSVNDIDTEFSFNGHAYWVDLLCGVSYCSCDALFKDNNNNNDVVEFGFIPLPFKPEGRYRGSKWVAQPAAYRTMGAVCDSFIRFVSIDGFQDPVKLKNRTVTVWKLRGHDQDDEPWELEHEFSLKTLWGFQGFSDLPKNLTPMYPLLSTKDADVVYLVLGECRENPQKSKFIPSNARYLLAVDMRKKTVTYGPLAHWFPDPFFSCDLSQELSKALVGPCNDKGIPTIKEPSRDGGNVAEAPMPMKRTRMKAPTIKEPRHDGGNVAEAPMPMKRTRMKAPTIKEPRHDGGNVAEAPMPMKRPRMKAVCN